MSRGDNTARRPEPHEAPRPRMNPAKIETWVDQAIQQAQRRGDFDNLPGAGQPLKNLDGPTDPDWWVKGLIEREQLDMSAAMPTTMSLRREREGFPQTLRHLSNADQVRAHLEEFNARVLADRKRPWGGPGSPPIVGRVDVEEMVAAWAHARETVSREQRQREQTVIAEPPSPTIRRRRWWRRKR